MVRTGPVLYWCDDCKQRRRFTYDLQSARLLRAEEGASKAWKDMERDREYGELDVFPGDTVPVLVWGQGIRFKSRSDGQYF